MGNSFEVLENRKEAGAAKWSEPGGKREQLQVEVIGQKKGSLGRALWRLSGICPSED